MADARVMPGGTSSDPGPLLRAEFSARHGPTLSHLLLNKPFFPHEAAVLLHCQKIPLRVHRFSVSLSVRAEMEKL